MKTFTRTLLLAALTTATGFFAACSQDAPAPDLSPAFEMTSRFEFAVPVTTGGTSPGSRVLDFTPAAIKGQALLTAPLLSLDFACSGNTVHFEVDRNQLPAKWLGTYAMRCQARPTAPVGLSFVHNWAGDVVAFRFSDTVPQLAGNLVITAYDSKRQLVSGRYEVTAPDQLAPSQIARPGIPRCDVILTGRFTNLNVAVQ
ncbi:hypothetical protein [Hymenobacter terricola]|uniref:hypothetical protein n=1 Tax=Hymenobacter terricola TaxID=2819236 RepID=UPI001B3057FC|nr:hypothetical protein [Hymenobacter terricola]